VSGNEPAPLLVVRALGTFEVLGGDGIAVFADNVRARQPLLKFLLCVDGFGASSAQAARALWPESSAETGLGNLRVAVSHLRAALRKANAERALRSQGGRVALDRTICDIDVARALAAPLAPSASLRDAAEHLRTFGGTFLPGDLSVEWTAPRRAEMRRRFVADLETALRIAEAHPASSFAIDIEAAGERAFSEEPDNEHLAEQLARFYLAQGRRVEALSTIERCAADAADRTALERLRSEIYGGTHRAPAEAPAERGERLVGRDLEREAALAPFSALEHGRGGAVLIAGPPGSGTTALANDVGARLCRRANAVAIEVGDARMPANVITAVERFFATHRIARERVVPSVARALSGEIPSLGARGGAGAPSLLEEPRFLLALERGLAQAATVDPLVVLAEISTADAASLALLRCLVVASTQAALAVVLVVRMTEKAFARVESLLHGTPLVVVELGDLSRFDAYELIERLRPAGDVEPALVVAQTGTNPSAIIAYIDGNAPLQLKPVVRTDAAATHAADAAGADERLRGPLDRALALVEHGRLATALPLLEAADEEAVLAGAMMTAARAALARARVYALTGSDRAPIALAFARARAPRANLDQSDAADCELDYAAVALELGHHAEARASAARARAGSRNSAPQSHAAMVLEALAENDRDARAARVRELLAVHSPERPAGELALEELRLCAALIAATTDAREVTAAARRADALLPALPPGLRAAQATIDYALALAARNHRSAPAAMRRAHAKAAAIDAPILTRRLAGNHSQSSFDSAASPLRSV